MADAIKFVHASDFHLERPLSGLAELPPDLKSMLASAPYAAAQRVFDTAVGEKVDFLLLAGDICHLDEAGPRAAAFLLSQFQRLAEREIMVYWCASKHDHPDRWPSAAELPENVVVFAGSVVEHRKHLRNGKPIATICGSGPRDKPRLPSEFYCEPETVFPIALACGEIEPSHLATQNVRYWALGGIHRRRLIEKAGTVAVYPGTPQSRRPAESGSHSCTLGRVDAQGKLRTDAVEVDVVRWETHKIEVAESIQLEDMKNMLADRCLQIRKASPDQTCLVKWQIATTGEFNPHLRSPEHLKDIVDYLRKEYGEEGGVWTVELDIEPPHALPASWYEEETILGDYLRAVGHYQSDDSIKLKLSDYLPDGTGDEQSAKLAQLDSASRHEILQRVALMGVDYLRAGEEYDGAH